VTFSVEKVKACFSYISNNVKQKIDIRWYSVSMLIKVGHNQYIFSALFAVLFQAVRFCSDLALIFF
jgi:hypothetical protein